MGTSEGPHRHRVRAVLARCQRGAAGVLGVFLRAADRLPTLKQKPRRPLPVTFLLWNHHAMGGTVTTVLRQAGALAERGVDVSVVSVIRHAGQDVPFHTVPRGVTTKVLVDRRELAEGRGLSGAVARWLDGKPSATSQISWGRERFGSLLLDLRVMRFVLGRKGIVIGTRIGLNLAVARFGHPRAIRIWQEHLQLPHYEPAVQRSLGEHSRRVHAVVCLTEADADAYRRLLGSNGAAVRVIPNAIPDEFPDAASLVSKQVVAVGRLERMKGIDLLIRAFAECGGEFPDWRLRIVGTGRRHGDLEKLARDLQVDTQVVFVGRSRDVAAELQRASLFVLSSRFEPFGIVLIEAMSVGLAIASFDARNGPRDILRDGENALVAPTGDVGALADAMKQLMRDEELRRRLGTQAREDAKQYRLSSVTDQWASLFDELAATEG